MLHRRSLWDRRFRPARSRDLEAENRL